LIDANESRLDLSLLLETSKKVARNESLTRSLMTRVDPVSLLIDAIRSRNESAVIDIADSPKINWHVDVGGGRTLMDLAYESANHAIIDIVKFKLFGGDAPPSMITIVKRVAPSPPNNNNTSSLYKSLYPILTAIDEEESPFIYATAPPL
jgi:hypothetical protein